MKKSIFALLVILFIATPLSAQHLGFRVGLINTDATIEFSGLEVDTKDISNLLLGIFADIPIYTDLINLQPEVSLLNRSYSHGVIAGGDEFSQSLVYVDLTALAKLNFGRKEGIKGYLGLGPTLSYALSGRITDANGERDVNFDAEGLNPIGLNYTVAVGLTFDIGPILFVEVRHVASVTNLFKDNTIDVRQHYLGINAGIMAPLRR
jgi:hypothetical protein